MTIDANNSTGLAQRNINGIPVLIDYNISQITPYVFVTAEDTARQFVQVASNGITCVINVADELPHVMYPPQSGIESLKYPIQDNPSFPALHYFDKVVDRIAANAVSNRRTLVYCRHGRSRSVTFILAYLIKYHHLPLNTAFALVKEKRQLALPNVGFWSQLKSYEIYHNEQKRQQTISTILRTFESSVTHGQQIMHKISNGLEHLIAQDQFVNVASSIISNTQTPLYRPRYRIPKRRISAYPNSNRRLSAFNVPFRQYF